MATTQLDASRQVKDASVTAGKLAGGIPLSKLAEPVIQADGGQALTANWNVGAFNIATTASTFGANDLVPKSCADSVAVGLRDYKDSVRAATTVNGAFATDFANGAVIDGVTLATGNRILIKDQTTGTEHGIYTVNATGAPTRATDADADAEVTPGMYVFAEEGTTNKNTGWILSNTGTVTLGTTALTFVKFTGGGSAVSSGAGLTGTTTFDVVSANTGIFVNPDNIELRLGTAPGLEIHTSGLRLARGTAAGQMILATGAGFDPTYVAMSGDATITDAGVVTVAGTITRNAAFVTRETPAGVIDGVNTGFTLANTPVLGSEELYLNGILQEPGTGNDYTISGAGITMASAPIAGDKLRCSYRR